MSRRPSPPSVLAGRSTRLALVPALAALTSCSCGSAPVRRVDPIPAVASVPMAPSAAPPASASAGATTELQPVLADPRLAAIARQVDAGDPGAASQQLERLLVEAPPSSDDRPRWLYQAARLAAQARRPADAARLYTAAATTPWALAPYASLGAAQQALAAARPDEALDQARRAAATPTAAQASAELLVADALEQKGLVAEAIPLWRASLAPLPASKPARWVDTSIKLARALLTAAPGAPVPPAAAEEALGLARRVAIEQPASPQARTALALEQSALDALPPDRRAALARRPEEEVTRAAALLDASRVTDAEAALAAVEQAAPAATRSADLACRIPSLRGKLQARRKQRDAAASSWDEAVGRCQGEAHVVALFQSGGLHATLGRHTEALGRYEQLEREAPTHRLADDARIKGAQAALALGDEARFSQMLERIDAVYPDGDLTTDGLFRLALHRIGKGDWSGAVAPLEASRRLRPREHEYWSAGRATYFLARAVATAGDRARALSLYEEVIREQPLSYYMALAHARLAEADPARADAIRQTIAAPPAAVTTPPAATDAPPLRTPAGVRAVELLRQGETELARAEFTAAGLLGSGAPSEFQWAVAQLYGQAGAAVLAHTIPRGKVSDWLDRYPVGAWRQRWELAYPRPYLADVEREAQRSGIPQSLAYAIMREESAFDPAVASSAPAYGLMQFTLDTGKHIGKKLGLTINEAALKTPAVSVALGCRYLADLRGRFPLSPALAIPSYNAGPGATSRWLTQRPRDDFDLFVERIPYEETRNYTKRVLKSYAAYLSLYEPAALPEVLRLPQRMTATAAGPPSAASPPDVEPVPPSPLPPAPAAVTPDAE